ncbi:hypothetical protein OG21DRAFT_1488462 [Imleria badia]|nr:hypothetical protein OG21DRAFT_1488462 [Imleria badia]
MEQHALAILEQNDLWNSGKFRVATPRLLYFLIVESQRFGGEVLDRFWKQLGTCDEKLKENIENLKEEYFVSAQKSLEVLFQGLDPKNVNFKPVLDIAAEFFTHLGITFMNPGGSKSGKSTQFSVSEVVSEDTDKPLDRVNKEGGFGGRNQGPLKALSFRHDGTSCLLTGTAFKPFERSGILPEFVHIIPNCVSEKPPVLKCIAMFAGATARDDVHDAHTTYDNLEWGIDAQEDSGKVKYFFRMVPADPNTRAPGYITLKDGEEIQFGIGTDGDLERLKKPIPRLCNLKLAVARVMKMSGAADIILKWKDQADDDRACGLVHEYVYSAKKPSNALLDQLKGADQIFAMICEELGLPHSLTLLYRSLRDEVVSLIARSKLTLRCWIGGEESKGEFLGDALLGLTIEDVEGIEIIRHPFDHNAIFEQDQNYDHEDVSVLQPFYRDLVTKIFEVRPMSSVEMATPWANYGNEANLEYIYGYACMLIAPDLVASRKEVVL